MQEAAPAAGQEKTCRTNSKTVTDTLVGEHSHHIVGYSLIKGIGDGEPIASERFTVGGHEWVSGLEKLCEEFEREHCSSRHTATRNPFRREKSALPCPTWH